MELELAVAFILYNVVYSHFPSPLEVKGLSDHHKKRGFVQSLLQKIPFSTSSAI